MAGITAARQQSKAALLRLEEGLARFETAATSIIVTGSFGRCEVTEGSDLDWVLLVDGPSDPAHFLLQTQIGEAIQGLGFKRPGRTGTFGQLASSHELVHHIAGIRDTNENLTRRILLLSESRAITNGIVRDRVVRNVLKRYIVHDRPAPTAAAAITIPHFLLNDIVRYWRTIASDYASKMWERQREGWALRNTKLRFSRKLLFAWGLLSCFSFEIFSPDDREEILADQNEFPVLLADFIRRQTDITPLDMLSRALLEHGSMETARKVLDAYDVFIAALANAGERDQLEKLGFEAAATNEAFQRLRDASHEFRDGLISLFFEDSPSLSTLMKKFGVF